MVNFVGNLDSLKLKRRLASKKKFSERKIKNKTKFTIKNLSIDYNGKQALNDISFDIKENEIFSIIGPANSGKTSFLKTLNAMDKETHGMKAKGDIYYNGLNLKKIINIYAYRRQIGVVFPLPVGLPLSIYDNVALSPRLRGIKNKKELDNIVSDCLKKAALWDEVKDRLGSLGSLLSGGQQQRLTIARALSQDPEVLILDEFSIAIDPVTTMKIEAVLKELKKTITIILVSNIVQQAKRLSDRTAFFLNGSCVEVGTTQEIFSGKTLHKETFDYIEGKFG